jgi:FkbM family methyltransferase
MDHELTVPQLKVRRNIATSAIQHLPGGRALFWKFYNKLYKSFVHTSISSTYFGASVNCDLRDLLGGFIYHFGIWEPHISYVIQSRLRPGDLFCDIGANIGYYSLLGSRAVGVSGSVVAVEPSPDLFSKLKANLAQNGCTNVRVVNVAISDRLGELTLYRGPEYNAGAATTVPNRGFRRECEVAALPVEQVLTSEERRRLRLIKIDVEGAEGPILRHFLDTLDLYSDKIEVIVELSDKDYIDSSITQNVIVRDFASAGFNAYAIPNAYTADIYLDFDGPISPVPVTGPLTEQTDVLFSKSLERS